MATTKISYNDGDAKDFGSTGSTKTVGGAITADIELTYDAALVTKSQVARGLRDLAETIEGHNFT